MISQVLYVSEEGFKFVRYSVVFEQVVVLVTPFNPTNFVFIFYFSPWQLSYHTK